MISAGARRLSYADGVHQPGFGMSHLKPCNGLGA